MDEDPKPSDPNDISQYKLDEYDEDTGGICTSAVRLVL